MGSGDALAVHGHRQHLADVPEAPAHPAGHAAVHHIPGMETAGAGSRSNGGQSGMACVCVLLASLFFSFLSPLSSFHSVFLLKLWEYSYFFLFFSSFGGISCCWEERKGGKRTRGKKKRKEF